MHRRGLLQRRDRVREGRAWRRARARAPCEQVGEVVVGARAVHERAAGRRPSGAPRARAGAAGAGSARGPWSPAWTPPRARRGRRASRAGSRTSCWPCAGCRAAAPSAWLNDAFSAAMAAAVVLALETRLARSPRRWASAPVVLAALRRKPLSVCWLATSSLTSRRDALSAGLKYLVAALASAPRLSYHAALPWMTFCSDLRVLGSSVLKSWSRSTIDVVLSVPSVAPSGSLGLEFGPGVSAM